MQITNAEALGVEGRGGYYDTAGVLRDMIQNHVFQVMSLVAMEPPISLGCERGARREDQGDAGRPRDSARHRSNELRCAASTAPARSPASRCPAIGEEKGVAPNSTDRHLRRAQAVLRQLALGRRAVLSALGQADAEARDRDRDPVPQGAASLVQAPQQELEPNVLVIRVQPDEGITLRIGAKVPGQITRIREVNMDFRYGSSFGVALARSLRAAAARLHPRRFDALRAPRHDRARLGDRDADSRRLGRTRRKRFPNTKRGRGVPAEADELIERDGREWRRP